VEIDNEFRNYIRPLSSEEYDKLEASILSEGIRDPLVIWQGILLDGYHRYKIAQEHGLEYKTVEVELPDRDAAKEWILVNQLGRRNLTEQEASYYRGKLYSAKKQHQYIHPKSVEQNVLRLDTAEELGKQYGVSHMTIKRDEQFSQAVDKVANEVGTEARNAILSGQAKVPKERVEQLIEIKHEAPELIEPILSGEITISKAMREIQRNKNESKPKPELPKGKYRVIYADPPWPVGSITMDKWKSPIEDKYPTMSIEDIGNLPINELAADECSLFLWTTHTFLPDALRLIEEWGFKYFCCITWDKGNGWTQNGFHKRTEFLLYAYKGGINIDQYGQAIPTIITEPSTQHSKKPDTIRELIKNKTPEPRLEMFARGNYEGWLCWGNEVNNE
jgi:N6-adenosine-specific RNA methylase IME4